MLLYPLRRYAGAQRHSEDSRMRAFPDWYKPLLGFHTANSPGPARQFIHHV